MRPDIRELIQSGKTCVLATVSEGQPHCSLMSYAADENGREIYMATLKNTKKYKNLVVNPSVSLLIDSREAGSPGRQGTTRALTITGTFQSGLGEQRRETLRQKLLARHPELADFLANPAAEIVVIKVNALQLLEGVTDAYFEDVI
ncbi:MAG: pyridoxamine 5'-phosphate oxidase family protein [Smithellaceae bacterium]|nr:pyridoxamine 5'-phosphate oxidase family protein [Smithellaceae bacterium]NLX52864.1 pyridoxamine 5'-phosphate oxidase family protein [Deltaproteobacteria bacterium]